MVFSSLTFLFVFLPAVLILTQLSGRKFRNLTLLISSLLFYAWGEGFFVLIMFLSILINYMFGFLIGSYKDRKISKIFLICGIIANLSLLTSYKYANFLIESLNQIFLILSLNPVIISPVHLPIGISFFTFQAISYIVDVYDGKSSAQKNFINIGCYISLFPQLIAGPIIRFHDVSKQLVERVVTSADVSTGIRRFVIGLGKKVLIANTVALTVDKIFAIPVSQLPTDVAWLGTVCYAIQIYFDFSGYSDMAIGLGRIFGFRYLENFNYPYISQSIREFWKRWHISLSNWFKDYLYVPLGGNRKGPLHTYFNLLTVFFLCGLWHGASWNFIAWGLIHGFFIIIERLGFEKMIMAFWRPIRHCYTLLVLLTSWVFFRTDSLKSAIDYCRALFGMSNGNSLQYNISLYLNNELLVVIACGLIFSTPAASFIKKNWNNIIRTTELGIQRNVYEITAVVVELLAIYSIFGASIMSLAAGVYNPFIYFRF